MRWQRRFLEDDLAPDIAGIVVRHYRPVDRCRRQHLGLGERFSDDFNDLVATATA